MTTSSAPKPQSSGRQTHAAAQFWLASVHVPGKAAATGLAAESEGFDGVSFGDTQNLAADPFAGLCLAAAATTRLGLMVGVTNPVTRVAAVTAAAIATVQVSSGGRAVLGVGRGDSALGHIGQRPASVAVTTTFVEQLQGYLAGEAVDIHGQASRIPWIIQTGLAKVPVDVAATGPRMLALGAAHAERMTINVGAIHDRLEWAVQEAMRVRAESDRSGLPLSLGAYVVVAAHPDVQVARDLARGPMAAYAHFSGMPGAPGGQLSAEDQAVVAAVTAAYVHSGHSTNHPSGEVRLGNAQPAHLAHIDDGFVDRFGIVGTPATCVARLRELSSLGLERFLLVEGRDATRPDDVARAHRTLVEEVIPALR
jgi:5,10-methylenetetrahydromethanopterin reductase